MLPRIRERQESASNKRYEGSDLYVVTDDNEEADLDGGRGSVLERARGSSPRGQGERRPGWSHKVRRSAEWGGGFWEARVQVAFSYRPVNRGEEGEVARELPVSKECYRGRFSSRAH